MTKIAKGKILLYYNPYSGNGMFKNNLDHIIDRCQDAGYQVMPVRVNKGKQIEKVLSNIDENEYSRIIACGGDGTLNICVNTMIRHDIHLPMAILPAGTANDFAYYFELPSDIDKALDIALGNKTTKADVGTVNGKCFINVAAMGAMVDVSQKTDPALKNAIGPLAYYLKGASELTQVHPIKVKLTTSDKVYDEEIYFMTVCNGESAGGFRKLSPHSMMNDGLLDVVAFRKMPIIEFAPLLFEVLNGRHPQNKNVLYFQTDSLIIEADENMPTDIDGENGEELPLHFGMLKRRLDIFVDHNTWRFD
ncbi:MAG: YegS/Rv2252/BmrU family lipid kinase [Clostridia bacterium]|nr:YegS/Rv2252/BmrU family lipid kinase [Clostridia bacterium]